MHPDTEVTQVAINHWPEGERPREKLLNRGRGALSDAEILAIWLRTGRRGQSDVTLTHTLMEHFGSIRAVFDATQTELCVFEGIGVTRYVELQASLELARRYTLGRLRRGQTPKTLVIICCSGSRDGRTKCFRVCSSTVSTG